NFGDGWRPVGLTCLPFRPRIAPTMSSTRNPGRGSSYTPAGVSRAQISRLRRTTNMKNFTVSLLATLFVIGLGLSCAPAALAQEDSSSRAQIVALDECDPTTFNAVLGPDFCKNVALGSATTLTD